MPNSIGNGLRHPNYFGWMTLIILDKPCLGTRCGLVSLTSEDVKPGITDLNLTLC